MSKYSDFNLDIQTDNKNCHTTKLTIEVKHKENKGGNMATWSTHCY